VNDDKNHYIDKIAHYPSKTKKKKREATLILSLPYCGFSILWCNLSMGKKRDHIRDEGHNAHNRCNHVDKTAKEPKHCEELKVSFDDVKCLCLEDVAMLGCFIGTHDSTFGFTIFGKLRIWLMHAFVPKFPMDLHHWGFKLINCGCCIGQRR
jgi:hypothetical protein